ncbi:hypothetical protein GJ744_003127 [Endocarpon pusillum]|uniref:MRG-binding protein n=1 Tax=Endocarpon pusillum TaxID=364733 RepID=A0A8H7AQW1_9EURO|nr:hypothetical protein GJ744_003127 [Endocarpon pusillum]
MAPRKSVQADIDPPPTNHDETVPEEVQKSLSRWTDEQEIALLKAIVRWKPVGVHKHFRMIAIHNYMISQGVVSSGDQHTTIPGLWTKLGSLYNLPVLDEREDSLLNSSSEENGSSGSKTPALDSRRESTIADTDEAGSSPAPGRRGARAKRRGGRVSKLQQEIGSSHRASKAASMTEDEPMEDAEQEDGEDGEGSETVDGDDAEDSTKKRSSARARGTPKGRGGRGRGGTRSRGRRK